MMNALKNFFRQKTPAEKPMDPQVAAAALLVEAALSDGVYVNIESDVIAEILLEAFKFDADKADAVLAEGEALAEEAVGSHQFTKHVKKLPVEERVSIIEGLYRVALADGEKSDIEDAYIRHVASLLHIDDISRAQARQAAEKRIADAS
ncbi:TerB family tellurite resistance protein [Hyphomonas sp.]|uniref:tellurite resistance TerB family protein n=1 Tax=Hyphomonas sp. TaxID=87 RepID=UPI0032D988BD